MPDRRRLEDLCHRIDGRPYPAWKDLVGTWRLGALVLVVDHVQGDPFAAPSRLRLRLTSGLPPALISDEAGRTACADWLLRAFSASLQRIATRRGSGRSGALSVYRPGPEIISRSAMRVDDEGDKGAVVEVRLTAGLPARGRRVLGHQGLAMLTQDLTRAAETLRLEDGPPAELITQVESVRHQRELRAQLRPHGLVAFLADGSILPRDSGISREPLAGAVPLQAPSALAVVLPTRRGAVRGLGIPEGVTVITGGGFHGKSTVLRAIGWGHLDHVPGDGRERVVARADTVKIRAEDGRAVHAVDISPFLGWLPAGQDTTCFSTTDASGSTSQAAAIVEAAEAGAGVLLLDEDTSATNLLVRDERMRLLVPEEREPITPFVARVRALNTEWGLSTVIVVGGVGDFLAVADRVIGMDQWQPHDLTARAHALAGPVHPVPAPLPVRRSRRVALDSLRPERRRSRARTRRQVDHGGEEIDLVAVEQVLDAAHAASLSHALRVLHEAGLPDPCPVPQLLDALQGLLDAEGPDVLSPWEAPSGELLWLRRFEVAAALSRLRTLAAELAIG